MKRIIYALLATLSGLVLLFSYRTSLDAVQPSAALDVVSSNGTSTAGQTTSDDSSGSEDESESDEDSSGSATSGTTGSSSGSSTTLSDGTFTGASVGTRYGPVQVQITVSGGRIADVQVVDYPDSNGRDRAINQRAIPVLVSETTQAQSSQISMVSGATYTSRGYAASLQSAIDQAGA